MLHSQFRSLFRIASLCKFPLLFLPSLVLFFSSIHQLSKNAWSEIMPSNYVEIRVKSAGIVLHCIALFCRTRSVSVACRLILSSIYPCGISASRVKTADSWSGHGTSQGLAGIFPGARPRACKNLPRDLEESCHGLGWLWGPPRFTHSRKTNNLCALWLNDLR